jgi:DNA anti-recombination protein RmuC
MSNIVEADYRVVQEHTLPVIASEILFIESQVARTALEGAIQIGLKLKEAKEQVEHGQWENWCHENLNYSKSKTEKLMRIASEYGDENSIYAKTYTCTDLSISKALSLLQVPEEEVKNFSENNDVESMTVKELNDKIKALESEKEMRAVEVNVLTEEYEKRLTAADEELEHIKNELTELQDSTADPDALADLEAKLEKAKEKEKKLKEEMKQEKESRDLQIQQAVEEKADQMRKEAEQAAAERLSEAESLNTELAEKLDHLKKKLESRTDESLLLFKLKSDQLQEVFRECLQAADEAGNPKLKQALKGLMQKLTGGIDE